MEKIILFGSKNSIELSRHLNALLVEVPDLYTNDLGAINDFVIVNLKQNLNALIIDADNIQRQDVSLALGMYLRLSFAELGVNSLAPIVIASDKRIKSFLNIKNFSQLLLTKNVYFQPRTEIMVQAVSPLEAKKFKEDFLDFINIQSGPEIGRHSLANQWGASVLWRMITQNEFPQNESLIIAQKSLYFKYVFAKTISDYESFFNSTIDSKNNYKQKLKVNAMGKRILLIDDEADKGWADVLSNMLVGRKQFEVIKEKVPNYDSLSIEARDKIESNNYDLIFLDLRMNGIMEESVLDPDSFSGMDILKHIKSINNGTQVVIFTASNKAWNLKALFDAGCDGYYIKESPEMLFPQDVSYSNFISLQNSIMRCFRRGYLRTIYNDIHELKSRLQKKSDGVLSDFAETIAKQLDLAFLLISKAETDEQFAFAYISLYMVVELVNKNNHKQDYKYFNVEHEKTYVDKTDDEELYYWDIADQRLIISEKRIDTPEILLDYCIRNGKDIALTDDKSVQKTEIIAYEKASEFVKIANFMKDNGFADNTIIDMYHRIQARNWFIHKDSKMDKKYDNGNYINTIQREIYSEKGFQTLFKYVKEICQYL